MILGKKMYSYADIAAWSESEDKVYGKTYSSQSLDIFLSNKFKFFAKCAGKRFAQAAC